MKQQKNGKTSERIHRTQTQRAGPGVSNEGAQQLLKLNHQATSIIELRQLLEEAYEELQRLSTDSTYAGKVEHHISCVNDALAITEGIFAAAEHLIRTGNVTAFHAAIQSPGGSLLFRGRELVFSGATNGVLAVLGGVATANVSLQRSPLQTEIGRRSHAALAGCTSVLTNVCPTIALIDAVLPESVKLSTTLEGGSAAMAALSEGLITGNSDGMVAVHEQLKSGEHGWLLSEASKAGEFWSRDGAFSTAGAELADWWSSP